MNDKELAVQEAPQQELIEPRKKVGVQWVKGQSGNPAGRPKVDVELRVKMRNTIGPAALRKLQELMANGSEKTQLAAATTLFAYAYGKPPNAPEPEKPRAAAASTDLDVREVSALRMIKDMQAEELADLRSQLADMRAENAEPVAAEIINDEEPD